MTSHGRPPAHARTVPESAIARLAAREHAVWTRLGGGPVVRQCVRLLIALTLADGMARLAHLREPVWSLITAVIVTQGSITETMSTGRDQIIGTLIGAGAGIAVIALGLTVMPWQVAFLVALPPLVWLSAWRGARRFALITLMIIVLFPSEGGAFARPFDRLLSILCGVVASVVVSYLVLHRPARREAFATAAAMFGDIATMLGKALERRADQAELVAMTEAGITKLLRIDALLTEASREGRAALARRDPMLARLPGVLRRVQGDAFLVARAVNAGKELLGAHEIAPVRDTLDRALRTLRERCDEEATHGRPVRDTARPPPDFLVDGSRRVQASSPEMRFVFSLLVEDLRHAAQVLWPGGEAMSPNTRAE